jgi:hypothetical protein
VAEGAAEGVPGAEAVGDLDRHRRRPPGVAGRRHGEHSLGALLDDGELDPAVEQRLGGVLGVSVPTATRHSSRLPMATVLAASAASAARDASDSSRQNCGR